MSLKVSKSNMQKFEILQSKNENVLSLIYKKLRNRLSKMGSIKDINGMQLTEAEDIKKRWQEYTEELYKKDLHDLDNHNSVITHLKPTFWNVKSSGPLEASL